jgi:hypothetical protein
MNASTTIPTTVELRRGHLIAAIAAAAALAAVVTWLLVAIAFDSGATQAQQSTSRPGAVTPAPVVSTEYPPDYRGMP